jgi:hypothetical protein
MSNDLIALVVAIGLGIVVVVVGWRRDLSEITRLSAVRPFQRGSCGSLAR